jgi:hypothetical protein
MLNTPWTRRASKSFAETEPMLPMGALDFDLATEPAPLLGDAGGDPFASVWPAEHGDGSSR